tara:strand:+ start:1303 stop:1482 length:180 start_codon:yes stop_codon:yes gene_type:complete
MIFTNAKYVARNGVNYGINVTIDGVVSYVPITDGNRHYISIKEQINAGTLTVETADPAD